VCSRPWSCCQRNVTYPSWPPPCTAPTTRRVARRDGFCICAVGTVSESIWCRCVTCTFVSSCRRPRRCPDLHRRRTCIGQWCRCCPLCWQPPTRTQAHARVAMVSWPWVAWQSDWFWGAENILQSCRTLQRLVRSSAPTSALRALWRVFMRQKINL